MSSERRTLAQIASSRLARKAYELAMMAMQSERYAKDRDYKDAIDAVFNLTTSGGKEIPSDD